MRVSKRGSLLGAALYSLSTSVILVPIGFLFNFLLARLLGPAGKGGYDLFAASGGLLIALAGLSLPSGITYVTARATASLRTMFRWIIIVAVAQASLSVLLLIIVEQSGFGSTFLPQDVEVPLIAISAVALYVFLNTLTAYWRAILIGQEEIIAVSRLGLLERVAHLVLLLVVLAALQIIGHPFAVQIAIGLLLISSLLSNLLFLGKLRLPLMQSVDGPSGFRQVVAYSVPSYVANLMQFLNYRLDIFLVSYFATQAAVGLYALAVSLAQLVWLPSSAIATVLLPRVAGQQELAAHNAYLAAQATRISFWISLATGVTLSLLSVIALPIVYGEAFRDSVAPLLWLMPGIILLGPASVLTSYIAAIGKPHVNLGVSLTGLVVTLSLDVLLIPILGIVGAAVASTLSYTASASLALWIFWRESKLPLHQMFILTTEDKSLAIVILRSISRRLASADVR